MGISSSYNDLLELFDCLGSLLKCLEIYTNISLTPLMKDMILRIILALMTKQIKDCRLSESLYLICYNLAELGTTWHREIHKEAFR